MAPGSYDSTIRLWDGISGAHIAKLQGHSDSTTAIAFSSDGSRLAFGSFDGAVQLWDVISGAHIAKLEGHLTPIDTIEFSVDGRALFTFAKSDDEVLGIYRHAKGAKTFIWNLTSQPPCRLASVSPAVIPACITNPNPLNLTLRDRWIQVGRRQDHRFRLICRIPSFCSPSIVDHVRVLGQETQSRVAVGCEDGRVIIIAIQDDAFDTYSQTSICGRVS